MADPALHLLAHGVEHLAGKPDRRPSLTRRALLRAGGLSLIGALTLPAAGLFSPAQAAFPFSEVADGIYVRYGVHEEVTAANCGAIANIGFIVGEDSVAVIDTGTTHGQGMALRAAVAAATDKPISHFINTHVHFDHCFGNDAFRALTVPIIGHKNLPRALADRGTFYAELLTDLCPDFAGTKVVAPTATVAETLDIDLGKRPLRLTAWPTAHTNTDLTVFDGRTGTLWTGDLVFAERLPTLDGSINGWLAVLDSLLPEDVRQIVPGHGAVSDGRAALAAERAYLEALREGVRQALADDLDIPETLARLDSEDWPGWPRDWQVVENVHGRNIVNAYTELEWE
ncbi:MAG: quinoprotein relay system zinc metallohydrolase 2 [Kiloniellaceae bacterium]